LDTLGLLGILFSISVIGNIFLGLSGNLPESVTGEVETLVALVVAFILAYLCFKYGTKKLDEVKKEKRKTGSENH
jgi:uncharacterized protein YacL